MPTRRPRRLTVRVTLATRGRSTATAVVGSLPTTLTVQAALATRGRSATTAATVGGGAPPSLTVRAVATAVGWNSTWVIPVVGGTELTPTVPDTGNCTTNGANLQTAINNAAIGDIIVLKSGATYCTATGFTFPAKGASWDNRRVTICCSRIADLSPGMRVNPSQTVSFANVVATASVPVLNFGSGARGYTIQGLNITNTVDVSNASGYITNLVEFVGASADLAIDRCWVHPLESVTNPTSFFRTAGTAFGNVTGANIAITNCYAEQFTGWRSSDQVTQTDCKVITVQGSASALTVKNNFLQGYLGTFMFVGGASATGSTTITSSADHTHAVLGSTAYLNVGDLVAFQTVSGYEAGQIQSISGNSVVFGPRTTDVGFTPTYVSHDLVAAGNAIWNGSNPDRLIFQRNTFDCLDVWESWVNPNNSTRLQSDHRHLIAYGMTNAKIIGNQFTGTTFGSLGLFQFQGQTGASRAQPYVMISNVLIMHNFLDGPDSQLCEFALNNANSDAAWSGHDVYLVNNLRRGRVFRTSTGWATEFSGAAGPIGNGLSLLVGHGINALHNTVRLITTNLWRAQGQPNQFCDIRDNISNSGLYWLNTAAVSTDFPNVNIATNLWVNTSGASPPGYITADFVVADDPSAHFVNFADADAGGSMFGYALTTGSPGLGTASDGTDVGCNLTTLNDALTGTSTDWAWPELPRAFLGTAYALPTGTTRHVASGGDLQAAINAAALGDVITLQAGATFTGNFTLPNKGAGSAWIYIMSDSGSLPAPGTRVGPADAPNMALVQTSTTDPVFKTAAGAHHYRFVGIEMTTTVSSGQVTFQLLNTDGDGTLSNMPHDIVVDRCYLHGHPTNGGRRGIYLQSTNTAVIESYFQDFKDASAGRPDTQAIMVSFSPGPVKIVNNFLSASAENVLFGGEDPPISQMVPADIELRNNHFFKPLSWNPADPSYGGVLYGVKNHLELKNVQRILVDGNTFENFWPADQNVCITMTPRNQSGTAPWCRVTDVTFTHNQIVNGTGGGIVIVGDDDLHPAQRTDRILIQNNVLTCGTASSCDIFQVYGNFATSTSGPNHLVIDHNTCLTGRHFIQCTAGQAQNFVFTHNIVPFDVFGMAGNATTTMAATLATYLPGALFQKNIILGTRGTGQWNSGDLLPAGNYNVATASAVNFVNLAGGDYHLQSSSIGYRAGYEGVNLGAAVTP